MSSAVPERERHQVRVEVEVAERHLAVVECRPPWRADSGPEWTRFRSRCCGRRSRHGCGRCSGGTGTSASTLTTGCRRVPASRIYSPSWTALRPPVSGTRYPRLWRETGPQPDQGNHLRAIALEPDQPPWRALRVCMSTAVSRIRQTGADHWAAHRRMEAGRGLALNDRARRR